MRLILDFGNTLKKLSLYRGNTLVAFHAFDKLTLPQIKSIIREQEPIDAVILSAVINYAANIRKYFSENFKFIELDEHTPVPVKVMYKSPHSLGKDRLAAVVAAHHLFPVHDVLVINAGTCITYDFINREAEYRGGAISPGVKMRFSALHTFTDKLPLITCFQETGLTGEDTETSIVSGVINGIKAEIDGIIDKYKQQKPEMITVLSGGDAKYFENSLKNSIFAIPNIVTEGLLLILNHNVDN